MAPLVAQEVPLVVWVGFPASRPTVYSPKSRQAVKQQSQPPCDESEPLTVDCGSSSDVQWVSLPRHKTGEFEPLKLPWDSAIFCGHPDIAITRERGQLIASLDDIDRSHSLNCGMNDLRYQLMTYLR